MNIILSNNLSLIHDIFNLFSLSFIIYLVYINWNIQFNDNFYNLVTLNYNGQYFFYLWKSSFLYFIVDSLWLILKPQSVKSPKTIIFHHIIILLTFMVPYYRFYQCGKLMSISLTVEINTLLLTFKRVLFNNCNYSNLLMNILHFFIVLSFYLSWFIIRLIMFPIITNEVYKLYMQEYLESNNLINIYTFPLVSQSLLCCLNYKWTFDLYKIKLSNKDKSLKYL